MLEWVLVILLLLVLLYNYVPSKKIIYQGRSWKLLDDDKAAHALLTSAYNKLLKLFSNMKKRYHIAETDDIITAEGDYHDRVTSTRRHVIAEQILTKFDPDEVYENHPTKRAGTSYTISKGTSMYLCVKQTESNDLVDENTLIFVILHELAHIGTYDEYSHSPKFWSTFRFLLDEAVLAGVYKRVDYVANPSRYCGMTINYQPMDDSELIDIDEYGV